jgi:hypothetical protein
MTQKLQIFLVWVACFCSAFPLRAQLSPGDLANPHAHLEGVRNCTQCHTIGQKVANDKCLNCHKDVQSRISAGKGFHASAEVKGKDCAQCHNDHHGRNFNLVRFDTKTFNHANTGWALSGKHAQIDCRSCHKPDLVQENHLKQLPNTYFGLRADCASCHTDVHQGSLKKDCAACHNTEAFAPATKFNHAKTDFPLVGKHQSVSCAECHKVDQRNGQKFQHFSDVQAGKCASCHQDPHQKHFATDCRSCHNEEGWSQFVGRKRFDHNTTDFTLRGAHKPLDCKACHQMTNTSATTVFQDRLQVTENQCATCHQDPHTGKFGTDCASCHQESSFKQVRFSSDFNHAVTGFALEGKHAGMDCKKCHTTGSMTAPIAHSQCTSCHADAHNGIFAEGGKIKDCALCHTVQGFSPTTFTVEQHASTSFALAGAHQATACTACHLKEGEKQWKFRKLGQKCADCHTDVHEGTISEKYYPGQNCTVCHSPETWLEPTFTHEKTGYVLEKSHLVQACSECHVRDDNFAFGKFSGTATACFSCHADPHQGQFNAPNGEPAKCHTCHKPDTWKAQLFDHQATKFPLEGKHAEVKCSACHKPQISEQKTTYTVYKISKFECRDCHQ